MNVKRVIRRTTLILFLVLTILTVGFFIAYKAIQAPKLSVPRQANITLSNVSIWNPGKEIVKNQDISIIDGRISSIRNTQTIESNSLCNGCFVMPGLIDAHIHTPPKLAIGNQELFALLYLKYGITTVRDLGEFDGSLPELKRRLNEGKLVGPRMYHSGRIIDGNPPGPPGALLVENQEEGREAVRNHYKSGVDCIKVYGNLSRDALIGVAREADQLGLALIGHTPHSVSFKDIKNFESQHYTGIPYLNKAAPTEWAYKSEDLISMTASDMEEVIDVMKENNISFLPTNANGISRLTLFDAHRFPPSDGFQYLPEFWKIAWPNIISFPDTEEKVQADLDALPAGLSFIKKAQSKGLDVLIGTDVLMPYVIPGESMHQQLALVSKALDSLELALFAATYINGKHIDNLNLGILKEGFFADMLVFKENPKNDLSKIKNWDFLIVNGRIYKREDIDEAVMTYKKHFRSKFYSYIMGKAYSFIASDYENNELTNKHNH